MAKKLIQVSLTFLLLFSNNKIISMDFKQYIVPTFFVVGCAAIFVMVKTIIDKQTDANYDQKTPATIPLPTRNQCDNSTQPQIQSSFQPYELIKLNKICKKAMNECYDTQIYSDQYLPLIKSLLPHLLNLPTLPSSDEIYDILHLICCKFNDIHLLHYIHAFKYPILSLETFQLCIDTAKLYGHTAIIDSLARLSMECFHRQYLEQEKISCKQSSLIKFLSLTNYDKKKIITKNISRYSYTNINLVANFFETKLWQIENNGKLYPIENLIHSCLTQSVSLRGHEFTEVEVQLIFLGVAVEKKYILLEKKILSLLPHLSLASKNPRGHTLLHLAYSYLNTQFCINTALKELISRNVIDINAQDESGQTVLHRALWCYSGKNAYKYSPEQLAIPYLLSNQNLNPNLKDINNLTPLDMITHFHDTTDYLEHDAYIINLILQHKNFDPHITLLYSAYYMKEQIELAYKNINSRIKIDIKKQPIDSAIGTCQLQLLAATYPNILHDNPYFLLRKSLNSFIKLCTDAGGRLTTCNQLGQLPVDIAYLEYQKNINADSLSNEITNKEMIYHLYLLNTPKYTPCHRVYSYIKHHFLSLPIEVSNIIMQLYYDLTTIERKSSFDLPLAQQINVDYNNGEKTYGYNFPDICLYYGYPKEEKEHYKNENRLMITY